MAKTGGDFFFIRHIYRGYETSIVMNVRPDFCLMPLFSLSTDAAEKFFVSCPNVLAFWSRAITLSILLIKNVDKSKSGLTLERTDFQMQGQYRVRHYRPEI